MSLFTFGTKVPGPAFSFASATPLTTGAGGRTALHIAVLHGDKVAVTELLRGGADVDAADDSGMRALHVAAGAAGGSADMCELLLEAGADINCVDRAGDTALHLAALCGGVATVRILLGWGAKLVMNGRGKTPGVMAEEAGWSDVVALFPAEGAWCSWEVMLDTFGESSCEGSIRAIG
ncbi:ankyrin repeat-containing domain protein [Morchella snyderi]|nr:ankyrin repeat-containing domain protein [Morchella snyderi]